MSARAQTCEMLRTLRQLWALGYELHQNAFPYMTRARDPARLRNWSAAPGPIASGWLRKFPGQYTERHLQKQQQRRHVVRGGAASGADVAAGGAAAAAAVAPGATVATAWSGSASR